MSHEYTAKPGGVTLSPFLSKARVPVTPAYLAAATAASTAARVTGLLACTRALLAVISSGAASEGGGDCGLEAFPGDAAWKAAANLLVVGNVERAAPGRTSDA